MLLKKEQNEWRERDQVKQLYPIFTIFYHIYLPDTSTNGTQDLFDFITRDDGKLNCSKLPL